MKESRIVIVRGWTPGQDFARQAFLYQNAYSGSQLFLQARELGPMRLELNIVGIEYG